MAQSFATTKLSSKGQVIIPETIRNHLAIHAGDQFLVMAEKDVIILKTIEQPNLNNYKELVQKTRKAAKAAGLTKSALTTVIKSARKKA